MEAEREACSVAIIVPAFNEAGHIVPLLESIAAMPGRVDEVVVVDAGSTDDTADVVREWAQKSEAPLRLITEVGRACPARARNIGIAHSSAEILVCIDCGTRPASDYLGLMVAPLAKGEADLVGGHLKVETGSRMEEYFSAFYPQRWQPGQPEPQSFAGASMAFRREAWERVEGFPEHLPTGEDPEFCFRMQRIGARRAFIPGAYMYWRQRKTLGAFCRQFYRYAMTKGLLRPESRRRSDMAMVAKLLSVIALTVIGCFWAPGFLILGGGILAWMALNYIKRWRRASLPGQLLVLPLLGLLAEASALAGFTWGRLRALFGCAPSREQPGQWPEGTQEVFKGATIGTNRTATERG